MKILVCIKQVLDRDTRLEVEPGGLWPVTGADSAFRISRFDELALEEALLIKDRNPATEINVLSVGPERAAGAIDRALAKGADHGIHLLDDSPCLPAFETASRIAEYARGRGFDLILAGVMSEDAMQCQVGPMLAAMLGLPCVVSVVTLETGTEHGKVLVESELEGGIREKIVVPLPALLTIQSCPSQPRYSSLSNILKAREKTIYTLAMTGDEGGRNRVVLGPLAPPHAPVKGHILSGTTEDKASQLLQILHERSLL